MSEQQLRTPVGFFIFNRPEFTARVFAEIARARPIRLLLVADGPRADRPGEADSCARVREIVRRIDWPCQVSEDFSEVNLGCRRRMASGIDWVFEQVSEAIILEDDCLPDPTFFRFCTELLEYYRSDTRIAMISGDNFQFGRRRGEASYYFTKYPHIWGWASWRRAWRHYHTSAPHWPRLRDEIRLRQFTQPNERAHWLHAIDTMLKGEIDTWDYLWTLSIWTQSMLCVMPQVNLVSNIGFGADATHTRGDSMLANMAVEPMQFPLRHPEMVFADAEADAHTAQIFFRGSRREQLKRWLRKKLQPA
jgi:hypothetical protein